MKLLNSEQILIRLLQNTHIPSSRRKDDILTIASLIKDLEKEVGSLDTVGKQLKLSKGTLKKFLSVLDLDDSVKELVKARRINSIEVIYFLSRCTPEEQKIVGNLVINETLSSGDIKDGLSPLKSQNPNIPIAELIKRLIQSKDKSVSVAYLDYPTKHSDIETIRNRIFKIIDKEFISLEFTPDFGVLKISKKGENKLRKIAKGQNQTLRDLLTQLMTA